MSNIDENKLNRQLLGVEKWKENKGIGTLNYYTGVGKTYSAIIIINRVLNKNPATNVVIIVPSDELKKQWKIELNTHIEDKSWLNNINVYIINTAVRSIFRCNLLVLDEIHEYYSDERIEFIKKCKYQFILGLTATWEDTNNRHCIMETICPIVDKIDEDEALANNYISKFYEYNLACTLTDKEREDYDHFSKIVGDNMNKFGKNNSLGVAGLCLTGDKKHKPLEYCFMWASKMGWTRDMDLSIRENRELNDLWHPRHIIGYARNLMTAIRERKNILYTAENKLKLAMEIIDKYPKLKTICFSQSTIFADKLATLINEKAINQRDRCVVYHSKLETIKELNPKGKVVKVGSTILKRRAIEAIKTGQARVISTASALDKGFNVKDIRLGITTSSTQNPTQHKQRGGRVKRIESYTEDITVLIVNIYVKDTKDEDWLIKRQSKSSNKVYWVNEVSKINYEPQSKSFAFKDI